MKKQPVLVPGLVLKESFLDVYQLTPAKLADDVQLSQSAIRQILTNKTKITLNVGLRLAKYFGNDVQYWIDLQNTYDLAEAEKDEKLSAVLKSIPKVQKPSSKAVAAKKAAGAKAAGRKAPAKGAKAPASKAAPRKKKEG
ncbi:MAG: HigA family addiction module antidote protein [Spirochaetaceae bacterium]|jgi:addiction module HigA family antidote|nr:HigA family addiction module antidote protein [Spirochaetaceae bacterium]